MKFIIYFHLAILANLFFPCIASSQPSPLQILFRNYPKNIDAYGLKYISVSIINASDKEAKIGFESHLLSFEIKDPEKNVWLKFYESNVVLSDFTFIHTIAARDTFKKDLHLNIMNFIARHFNRGDSLAKSGGRIFLRLHTKDYLNNIEIFSPEISIDVIPLSGPSLDAYNYIVNNEGKYTLGMFTDFNVLTHGQSSYPFTTIVERFPNSVFADLGNIALFSRELRQKRLSQDEKNKFYSSLRNRPKSEYPLLNEVIEHLLGKE